MITRGRTYTLEQGSQTDLWKGPVWLQGFVSTRSTVWRQFRWLDESSQVCSCLVGTKTCRPNGPLTDQFRGNISTVNLLQHYPFIFYRNCLHPCHTSALIYPPKRKELFCHHRQWSWSLTNTPATELMGHSSLILRSHTVNNLHFIIVLLVFKWQHVTAIKLLICTNST